jgi:peroxiredoxin
VLNRRGNGVTRKAAVFIAVIGLIAALYLHRRIPSPKASSSTLPAPAIALTDLSGDTLNPSSYKGKVVLINFWAAWCTPCRAEIPQFMTLQDKYRSRGFQAVGISLDDPEGALRDFCRESGVNYPIVMGNQKIAEAFGGVLGLPTTFLIGRDGLIHAKYEGATDFRKLEQEITALLQSGH